MMNLNGQLSSTLALTGTYSPTMLLTGTIPDGLTRNAEIVLNALAQTAMGAQRIRFALWTASGLTSIASSALRYRQSQEASNATGAIVVARDRLRFVNTAIDAEGTTAAASQLLNDLTHFFDTSLGGVDLTAADTELLPLQVNSTGMDRAPLAMD